jgi:phosphate-selective porin OprO/OprP
VSARAASWLLAAVLATGPGLAQDLSKDSADPSGSEEAEEALGEELSEWRPKNRVRSPPWWIDVDAWTVEWKNGFHVGRNDGRYDLLLGGQFMFDAGAWYEDDGLVLGDGGWQSGADVRRARLYAQGVLFGRGLFKIDYEISDSEFKDFYVGVREVGPVRVLGFGFTKEPFSLEQATSLRNHMFMERSLANALAPRRETGIFGSGVLLDARVRWAAGGFFLNDSLKEDDDPIDGFDDDWELALRVTGLPIWRNDGRRLLLVGFSYSHVFATNERDVSLSARPESWLVDPLIETGNIGGAENLNRFGIEAAWADGPLLVQGEWILLTLDPSEGSTTFWGAYLQAGWLLTGERRHYGRAAGVFGRVVPKNPFSWRERHWGAFEIAARFSMLDLTDSVVRGGTEWNATLGLNWYLRSNLRFAVNWVHGRVHGEGSLDVVQARLQFDL